jgi:hypothetical protein
MATDLRLPKAPERIGPAFVFSNLERALYEGFARRAFGSREMEQVIEFFGGHPATCVYCGVASPQRWDHLVPVRDGGETVMGNMVPACAHCDDSKQDSSLAEWWESVQRNLSPDQIAGRAERLAKLQAYASHFGYKQISLEDRLTPEEAARLGRIREAAKSLRNEIESLFRMYGDRTQAERST